MHGVCIDWDPNGLTLDHTFCPPWGVSRVEPYVKPVVWVCVGFIGLLATYLLGLGPTHGIRRVNGLAYSDGCDGGVPYIPICGGD